MTNAQAKKGGAFGDDEMEHFWFDYRGQPDPGKRVWTRTDAETWEELYPNGTKSRYKRTGRAVINGSGGVTAKKIEGDTEKTFTRNDGSFEVFIPDRTATNRIIFVRHRLQGDWSRWVPVAAITVTQ